MGVRWFGMKGDGITANSGVDALPDLLMARWLSLSS